jgi:urease accessory protein
MQKLESIIGRTSDPIIAEQLHTLEHAGLVEYVALRPEDMQRHRLRVMGDQGTEYAIAIPRTQLLTDGVVLMLEPQKAVVVHAEEQHWLRVRARTLPVALELGYLAGNMHWKVRFERDILEIALQGLEDDYLVRLGDLMASGQIEKIDDD